MTPLSSPRIAARTLIVSGILTFVVAAEAGAQAKPPAQSADRAAIRALLVTHEFPKLEAMYASYASSMRADITTEDNLVEMKRAFEFPDPALGPHLDAWVTTRHSVPAYFARAAHSAAMGAHARGEKEADHTKDTQFDAMATWYERATEDIASALRIDSSAVAVYWVLQGMVMERGDLDENRMVLRQALRYAPASLYTRYGYMWAVRPRWGGSYGEMRRFAEASQQFAAVNPKLRALRGFAAWDQGVGLAEADSDAAAVRKFTEALSYGEHWEFRTARGFALYYMNREGDAIRDFNAAIAQRPQYPQAWAGRARAYWDAAKKVSEPQAAGFQARARADLQRALQIDRYDSEVAWAAKQILGPPDEPEHR